MRRIRHAQVLALSIAAVIFCSLAAEPAAARLREPVKNQREVQRNHQREQAQQKNHRQDRRNDERKQDRKPEPQQDRKREQRHDDKDGPDLSLSIGIGNTYRPHARPLPWGPGYYRRIWVPPVYELQCGVWVVIREGYWGRIWVSAPCGGARVIYGSDRPCRCYGGHHDHGRSECGFSFEFRF